MGSVLPVSENRITCEENGQVPFAVVGDGTQGLLWLDKCSDPRPHPQTPILHFRDTVERNGEAGHGTLMCFLVPIEETRR